MTIKGNKKKKGNKREIKFYGNQKDFETFDKIIEEIKSGKMSVKGFQRLRIYSDSKQPVPVWRYSGLPTSDLEKAYEHATYYNLLTEDEKIAYRAIYANPYSYVEFSAKIYYDDIIKVCEYLKLDFPQYYFFVEKFKVYFDPETDFVVAIDPYKKGFKKFEFTMNFIQYRLSGLLDEIEKLKELNSNDVIVKRIFKYLCENVKYCNTENMAEHDLIGPLVFNKSVCQGISEALQYICNISGIKCVSIQGPVLGTTERHQWNVYLNDKGKYVLVDATLGFFQEKNLFKGRIFPDHIKFYKKFYFENFLTNFRIFFKKIFKK